MATKRSKPRAPKRAKRLPDRGPIDPAVTARAAERAGIKPKQLTRVDTVPLEGIDISRHDLRFLATQALRAIGVNHSSQDPLTPPKIMEHAIAEATLELEIISRALPEDSAEAYAIAVLIKRLDFVATSAEMLAKLCACEAVAS